MYLFDGKLIYRVENYNVRTEHVEIDIELIAGWGIYSDIDLVGWKTPEYFPEKLHKKTLIWDYLDESLNLAMDRRGFEVITDLVDIV